jgi:hypothetical protein
MSVILSTSSTSTTNTLPSIQSSPVSVASASRGRGRSGGLDSLQEHYVTLYSNAGLKFFHCMLILFEVCLHFCCLFFNPWRFASDWHDLFSPQSFSTSVNTCVKGESFLCWPGTVPMLGRLFCMGRIKLSQFLLPSRNQTALQIFLETTKLPS